MSRVLNAVEMTTQSAEPCFRQRIIQVHPSLRCNLACAHCYSSSSPESRQGLGFEVVARTLEQARGLGYRICACSGGEPLLYRPLPELLRLAKSLGMQCTVVTNGMVVDERRLAALRENATVVAISVDGPPEIHNRMRRHARAFEGMQTGVARIRDAGITFGFVHTLTRHTWGHLPWLAEFAAAQGAKLLQIHALESAGRAATDLMGDGLCGVELASAYLAAKAIQYEYQGQFFVQLDLLHRRTAMRFPQIIHAGLPAVVSNTAAGDVIDTIVLDAEGWVLPVAYGFSRELALGNVLERPLDELWGRYGETRYAGFRALCEAFYEELVRGAGPEIFNWTERMVRSSHQLEELRGTAGV